MNVSTSSRRQRGVFPISKRSPGPCVMVQPVDVLVEPSLTSCVLALAFQFSAFLLVFYALSIASLVVLLHRDVILSSLGNFLLEAIDGLVCPVFLVLFLAAITLAFMFCCTAWDLCVDTVKFFLQIIGVSRRPEYREPTLVQLLHEHDVKPDHCVRYVLVWVAWCSYDVQW